MHEPEPREEPSDSELVHRVMAECIDAWQTGGGAAVEALLVSHPELAPLVRERLEKLQRAGLLGVPDPDGPAAELPAQLGEFRLGKRIGSGGMGVVHVAEQLSLGRTVALKLVRPEQRFFPGARARFRREVEAIARLGDAGIVPIHSVGEDQGIDFFAMEYVRGASLGEVIAAMQGSRPESRQGRDIALVAAARAETPMPEVLAELFAGTWVMACCRIVARMARAVHHAHERGVVHRDLKPNNAMVTPDGRVLLLDFGLAAAAGTSRITRSGAMLGTPHYMAPEQLLDGEIDARTDVYALGVTLHELLALRPPFHSESSEALRQQILQGTRAPLRDANPEVPRDVATIVAVASDRDPVRRYRTAQALADDLERFLQHRPIHAQPIGPVLRSVRWAQRHPALATGASLLLLGLAGLPFVVSLSRGSVAQRAEANLRGALDAVSRMLVQARSSALQKVPGLDDERLRQVADAGQLMARLHRENPEDPAVAALFVRGAIRVAEIRRLFGDHAGAIAALDECEPVLASLRARFPDDAAYITDEIACDLNRGSCLAEQGRVAAAAQVWRGMLATHGAKDVETLTPDVASAIASCHNNLGKIAHAEGAFDDAIRHLRTSVELETRSLAPSDTIDLKLDRCRTRLNLGTAYRAKGDRAAAEQEYAGVAASLEQLATASADEPEVQRELARTAAARAALASAANEYTKSRPLRDEAVAAMEKLAAAFPDRSAYRQELGVMLHDAAGDAFSVKDFAAATALSDRAIASHRALLQRTPDNAEFGSQLATFLRQRAIQAVLQQKRDAAVVDLREAAALQERIVKQRPDEPYYAMEAAATCQELGVVHMRAEAWQPSRDAFRQARDHYETMLAKGHAPAREPKRLPKLLTVLAQVELMCDDFDAVMACLVRHQQLNPMPSRSLRQFGENLHVTDRADFQELLRTAEAQDGKR